MATVIDRLIIELGLDPKDFEKGQKKAASEFLKTRDDAKKTGQEVEDIARRTAMSVRRMIGELLTLFGVVMGSRALANFVGDLTKVNAEIGRFGSNLNESPQRIYAWQNAVERMGGTGAQVAQTFEKIGKALYDLHTNGQMLPKEFSQLQAATQKFIRTDQGVDAFLRDTASALKELAQTDPSRAFFLAQGMGIDAATANLMIKYGDAIGAYLDEVERSTAPTDKAIKSAQELQNAWVTLQQHAVTLGTTIVTELSPPIIELLKRFGEWVTKNQEWIRTGIVEGVKSFAEWVAKIDWSGVVEGARSFANAVHDIVTQVGGVINAVEILFALWASSKFLTAPTNMRLLASGGAAGGAAAGGGLLALLGKLSPWLAMLTLSGDTPNKAGEGTNQWGETPEQEKARHARDADRAGGYSQPPGGGPASRGRDRGLTDRERSLDEFLGGGGGLSQTPGSRGKDNLVDGRPVSRANPMPVALVGNSGGSGGGGFWSWLGGALGAVGSALGSYGSSDDSGDGGGADGPAPPPSTGAMEKRKSKGGAAKGEIEAYIRQEAIKRGIDPNIAVRVAQSEGGLKDPFRQGEAMLSYGREESYGPFQLHMRRGGVGVRALKAGIDPRVDWRGGVQYALDEAAQKGWGQWFGAAKAGIGRRTGLKGARAIGVQKVEPEGIDNTPTGATGAASLSSVANDNSVRTSTNSQEINIGKMDIHTRADNSDGIARDFRESIRRTMDRNAQTSAANYGLK